MEIDTDTFEKYEMARQEAWKVINKVSCLAQMIASATQVSESQKPVDGYAVGFLCEMIASDVMEIEEIFDCYLGSPRDLRLRDEV